MESQPKNPEFRINPKNFHPCETHKRHCVVTLSTLISTGSTQENIPIYLDVIAVYAMCIIKIVTLKGAHLMW